MATRKKSANAIVEAAELVQTLSDIFLQVKKKRFAITQSGISLTDVERLQLDSDYDAARDAYYKGLADFVDAADPTLQDLMTQAANGGVVLENLQIKQENAVKLLGAISGLVGLAGKILALGTL